MGGFRLGRIMGFEIRVDFSWFIIFFLILWSFTAGVFPAQVPGQSRAVYFAMGLSGALLFFASLLLHELSHSVVARAKGIPVDGITLFIFGGMAHTRSEAQTPGDEFLIAGVGPLASIAIGLLLAGLWQLGRGAGWHPAVLPVLQYIAWLNIVLAVFNLLPGFPLDGGRLFRAAVWKFTGSMTRATRTASAGGRVLAYLLVGLGLYQAFTGAVMSGLWLVFIGWFLRNAAISSYQQHLVREALAGATARQVMTPVPQTVPEHLSLQSLMDDYFLQRRFQSYPVDGSGQPVGIVTLHQVRDVPREDWPRRRVADTMTPATQDIIVAPEEDMASVLDKLRRSPVRRVLVLRNGRLEGIITASDVTAWLERMRSVRE